MKKNIYWKIKLCYVKKFAKNPIWLKSVGITKGRKREILEEGNALCKI
ncbi:MAG: hypothetical protein H7296_04700 [Bacteroidia bacterium]|nr:hypothetical protein [Bacteroidia bacterium]